MAAWQRPSWGITFRDIVKYIRKRLASYEVALVKWMSRERVMLLCEPELRL